MSLFLDHFKPRSMYTADEISPPHDGDNPCTCGGDPEESFQIFGKKLDPLNLL